MYEKVRSREKPHFFYPHLFIGKIEHLFHPFDLTVHRKSSRKKSYLCTRIYRFQTRILEKSDTNDEKISVYSCPYRMLQYASHDQL